MPPGPAAGAQSSRAARPQLPLSGGPLPPAPKLGLGSTRTQPTMPSSASAPPSAAVQIIDATGPDAPEHPEQGAADPRLNQLQGLLARLAQAQHMYQHGEQPHPEVRGAEAGGGATGTGRTRFVPTLSPISPSTEDDQVSGFEVPPHYRDDA